MSPANAEKIGDPEKQVLQAAYNPTASQQSSTVEKPLLKEEATVPKPGNMSRIQHFFFTFLFVALLTITLVSATANSIARVTISAEDKHRFQELLNSVDPVSLHNVLHDGVKDKYQHGIYQEDKTAMEVVHEANAEVAYSLIELAKRQAGNGTVTTTVTTETSTAIVEPTTTPPSSSQVVTPPSSESSQPPATNPTTAPTVEPTTAPTVAPTNPTTGPTTGPTSAATTPTTAPSPLTETSAPPGSSAAAPTTASSPGQSTNGASPTPSSTAGSPSPSSDSPSASSANSVSTRRETSSNMRTVRSSSTLATETSSSGSGSGSGKASSSAHSITQQTIYTTTLANGDVSTVTSVTIVAGQAEQTGGSSSKTSSAKGSLQTNGALSVKNMGMNGILGALGMVVVGAL